jgi:hypothetical protein
MMVNHRAKRAPACRAWASFRPSRSRTRSSTSAVRQRSTSVPPIWCAMSSVSHTASAVASASRRRSTSIVRSKSVVRAHSRRASSNAGCSSAGERRPTSKSACGMERPRVIVLMRNSSIRRGHASRAAARRRARRERAAASGASTNVAPATQGTATPPKTTQPATAPAPKRPAARPTISARRGSSRPDSASHSRIHVVRRERTTRGPGCTPCHRSTRAV